MNSAHTGSIPTAGPAGTGGFVGGFRGGAGRGAGGMPGGTTAQRGAGRLGGGMGGLLDATTPGTAIVAALEVNASRYTWVAAAIGSNNAAGLQLATQQPVMAIGGFNGSDPSPTLAQFQAYAQAGKIHYFVAGGVGGNQLGGSTVSQQIVSWVEAHYTKVTIGGSTFYDLTRPTSSATSN